MLEDRRLAVLRAIVEDYVATHEPVGSKALVERHHLGVSPATIRNDMAALEDEGYIAQPHTSAGRVPTDLGYRLFVDRLSGVKPLSSPERRAISEFLDSSVDLDDVMVRTVRLLAQITRQVALVQYPSLSRSSVRHIELIALSTTRLIMVLITDSGRVEQRNIECTSPVNEVALGDIRARLLVAVSGKPFSSIPEILGAFSGQFPEEMQQLVTIIQTTLLDVVAERIDDRVVLGGTAHLARYGEAFPLSIQPVLEALEEQVVLLRLLGESSTNAAVTVRIGHENPVEGMEATSVVTARYGIAQSATASLGVVGPTRMDYAGNIAAVQAVAQYVGRILDDQ
ncbi:MAG: heat-inducible transcriptional repressor HrcA [Actinomycetota bacterium]|nr:heat-inducible transcriptional repressor HrcA [Actinomycetota bacterium]